MGRFVAVRPIAFFSAIISKFGKTSSDLPAMLIATTQAAQAAADAATAIRKAQTARASGMGSGFMEAARVIRQPGPFGSENHEEAGFLYQFQALVVLGKQQIRSGLAPCVSEC